MKKIKLSVVIFSLAVFLFPIFAGAQEVSATPAPLSLPVLTVKDLVIDSSDGGVIKGSFTIANEDAENGNIVNAGYRINLLRILDESTKTPRVEVIDSFLSKERFLAKQGESEVIDFSYNYPANIISGKYELLVSALLSSNTGSGFASTLVDLTGDNRFVNLQISDCRILKDGNEFSANLGVLFFGDQNPPKGKCVAQSLVGEAITVIPKIQVTDYPQHQDILKTIEAPSVTIDAYGKKEIDVDFPNMINSASYVGELTLYEGGKKISQPASFRWTIAGVSGKLFSVALDNPSYTAGQTANATIFYGGPLDRYWTLDATKALDPSLKDRNINSTMENFYINVLVRDKNTQQICGQKKQMINVDETSLKNPFAENMISVPLNNECAAPIVEAQIGKGNDVFSDIGTAKINNPSTKPAVIPAEKSASMSIYNLMIILTVILIIIIIIIFWLKKNKNIRKTNLLLIFIIFASLFFILGGEGVSTAQAKNKLIYIDCINGSTAGPVWKDGIVTGQFPACNGDVNGTWVLGGTPGYESADCACPHIDVPPTPPYCRTTIDNISGLSASVTLEKGKGFDSGYCPKPRSWVVYCGGDAKPYSYDGKNSADSFGPNTCTYDSGGTKIASGIMICNDWQKVDCIDKSVSFPQDGECGNLATKTIANQSDWGSATYNFCDKGTVSPLSPGWPSTPGGSTNWTCQGSGGGINVPCGATRASCVDTSWSPDPKDTCTTSTLTQTSNCHNNRTVAGTKNCSPAHWWNNWFEVAP